MIVFEKTSHTYRLDGKVLPNVSTILNFIFPDKYKNIPAFILQNKATHGTKVHSGVQLLEAYQTTLEQVKKWQLGVYVELSIEEYLKIREKHNFTVLEMEQVVYTQDYAGTFDLIIEMEGKRYLCDIKTTAELDEEYLSWQLSLYEYAYGKTDGLYAIWLPKGKKGEFVKIKRKTKKEIEEVLKRFKEEL